MTVVVEVVVFAVLTVEAGAVTVFRAAVIVLVDAVWTMVVLVHTTL